MYFTEEPPLISPELQLLSVHSCDESLGGCRTWSDHQRALSHTVCQEPAEKQCRVHLHVQFGVQSAVFTHSYRAALRTTQVRGSTFTHIRYSLHVLILYLSVSTFRDSILAPFQRQILPSSAASVRYFSLQHFYLNCMNIVLSSFQC